MTKEKHCIIKIQKYANQVPPLLPAEMPFIHQNEDFLEPWRVLDESLAEFSVTSSEVSRLGEGACQEIENKCVGLERTPARA
jgi:hypothetical protein